MKSEINFLPKPEINVEKLSYIKKTKKVYANLYEIKLLKDLKLCQYPFQVTPEIEAGDLRIRGKIFKACKNLLKTTYGECFISGDSIFAINKIDEPQTVKANIYLKKNTEYIINIQKCAKVKIIKEEDIQKDQLAKQFIELLIYEILKNQIQN